jgi:hypothetical protein
MFHGRGVQAAMRPLELTGAVELAEQATLRLRSLDREVIVLEPESAHSPETTHSFSHGHTEVAST